MMQMVHELPGTTFSNPQERGRYDSQRLAVLTVGELERWPATTAKSTPPSASPRPGGGPQRSRPAARRRR